MYCVFRVLINIIIHNEIYYFKILLTNTKKKQLFVHLVLLSGIERQYTPIKSYVFIFEIYSVVKYCHYKSLYSVFDRK